MPTSQRFLAPGITTWLSKFIASLFAAVALVNTMLMTNGIFPKPLQRLLTRLFQNNMITIHVLPSFFLALLFCAYWQRIEKNSLVYSAKIQSALYAITRYWLAFQISVYGFAKLLQTQFSHSFQRADIPAGNLNGFELTWHFFSYSYPLTVIIGLLQICGSALLLTRRTTLLGVTILLPVLINILLINIFYRIVGGAFMNSVLFTLGLLYLLFLRWNDLKKVFFSTAAAAPVVNWGKFIFLLKPLPIVAAYLLIFIMAPKKQPTAITGKWKVDMMIRGRDTIKQDTWQSNSSVWSNIYLEEYGQFAICANPYIFENKTSEFGIYKYDSTKEMIQLAVGYPRDTINLKIINRQPGKMEWKGLMQNDTTDIFLSGYTTTIQQENW